MTFQAVHRKLGISWKDEDFIMKFTLNFLLKKDKVKNDEVKTGLSIDVRFEFRMHTKIY